MLTGLVAVMVGGVIKISRLSGQYLWRVVIGVLLVDRVHNLRHYSSHVTPFAACACPAQLMRSNTSCTVGVFLHNIYFSLGRCGSVIVHA